MLVSMKGTLALKQTSILQASQKWGLESQPELLEELRRASPTGLYWLQVSTVFGFAELQECSLYNVSLDKDGESCTVETQRPDGRTRVSQGHGLGQFRWIQVVMGSFCISIPKFGGFVHSEHQ